MTATEHVERQITVSVVIAVEEPAFLMPVQRVIGGIKVENDLARRLVVRIQELRHQQRLDGGRVVADLVIARGYRAGKLETVQRRFARDRRTVGAPCLELAG